MSSGKITHASEDLDSIITNYVSGETKRILTPTTNHALGRGTAVLWPRSVIPSTQKWQQENHNANLSKLARPCVKKPKESWETCVLLCNSGAWNVHSGIRISGQSGLHRTLSPLPEPYPTLPPIPKKEGRKEKRANLQCSSEVECLPSV